MGFKVISYKFIAAAALTAAKTPLYRMTPQRPSGQRLSDTVERQDVSAAGGIGVYPDDALGRSFITDLSIGTTERADDMVMTDVICNISRSINVVKTQLVGLAGTIKEYITPGDYDISISVGLVCIEGGNVIDRYPSEGVAQLRRLLDTQASLYVSSDLLRLFDITRMAIDSYTINQTDYNNYQLVDIRASSDEDYVIKCNEY